jgi:hypothetical protein
VGADLGGGACVEVLEEVGEVVDGRGSGMDRGREGVQESSSVLVIVDACKRSPYTSPSDCGSLWAAPRRSLGSLPVQ